MGLNWIFSNKNKQLNRYELVAFNFQLYYIVLIENITYTKLY